METTVPRNHAERDPLIGYDELSEWLDVPVWTLRKWRHHGKGPAALKIGGHVRFRPSDVERWLAESESDR